MTDDWITCEHCGMTYNPVMRHSCGERDKAREEVTLLRQEISRSEAVNAASRRQCESLERERDCLRATLERYGRHRVDCRFLFGPCTCGLETALAAKEEPISE